MILLSISTDRKLFVNDSAVLRRQQKLLEVYDVVHIIVFAGRQWVDKNIEEKIFIYSTNSRSRYFYIFDAIRLGLKICSKNHITHITCQDPFETGLVGVVLKWLFKTKLELQIHTVLGSPYFFKHRFLDKVRFFISRLTLRFADSVRVVSKQIADYVAGFVDADKIYIKPVAVDVERIKHAPITVDLHQKYPQFKKIVLMVSRLEPQKNISLALEAFACLNRPEIGLVVVGTGEELAKLESLARSLNVPAVFEGQVNELASYYKTADLFLHTALYEGYGMVLVEAQAAGLPIVSTDVGVAREVGAHIVSFSPQEIADKINTLL